MRLTTRTLNRTLWVRQRLVAGSRPEPGDAIETVHHLIGLQAQESLAPYLALAARLPGFDPAVFSQALGAREVVRVLSMRGTVHALTPEDALALRPWTQPMLDRVSAGNQLSRPARDVPSDALVAAASVALADGPLPVAEMGARLASRWPDVPEAALRNAARERVPMVQVPPRGQWRRSGGVVYELLTTWLGEPLREADVYELVRRYLRAYGPATAADMTAWSGVTRLGPVFAALRGDLVIHEDEKGRTLFDVADGVIADPDLDLPPLLLGNYDNLWLSHADRSRIATDENRRAWMGPNGGVGAGVFVDGMLEGWWNGDADGITVRPCREFTRRERSALDDEIARVRAFLAS
ncbi:winged helix DNA-binding domain-containing protein [Jatrophihabitans fulvus]